MRRRGRPTAAATARAAAGKIGRRPLALAAMALAVLSGCATFNTGVASPGNGAGMPADAQAAQARGDHLAAARAWERASLQSQPVQAIEFRLRAAEAATDGNDYQLADTLLQPLAGAVLEPQQQQRVNVLHARAALARNDTAGALRLLPAAPEPTLAAERVLLWRGRALFQAGDPLAATQTLVQRERFLDNPQALADNRSLIWNGLGGARLDASTLARAGGADLVTRGWIELANLSHRNSPLEFYESWRQRYPGHPGQERLASLLMPPQAAPAPAVTVPQVVTPAAPLYTAPAAPGAVPARPGFFALLLPQSGALAGFGETVHAGFAAAAARTGGAQDIRVYDVGGGPSSVVEAYNRAVADGAGVVVGPLLKEGVTALAQSGAGGLRVPVLALNYLDYGRGAPAGLYQFGLAPEDEARAAAEDAVSRGLRRALVMVQDNERGNRVQAAFEQRLRELGGEVAGSGHFFGPVEQWSSPVAALLRYRPVDDKKKLAELRAKAQPGVDPQRRNDFDVVFIGVGDALQAREIASLFRYYHADRIPTYGTSAVNEGTGDFDLAGIRFCDAPWLLDDSGTYNAIRADALNGRGMSMGRFYVMGGDAFQIALRISQNSLHALDELPGDSGTLRVGDDGSVRRSLVCAQATEGAPRPLGAPDSTAPP